MALRTRVPITANQVESGKISNTLIVNISEYSSKRESKVDLHGPGTTIAESATASAPGHWSINPGFFFCLIPLLVFQLYT